MNSEIQVELASCRFNVTLARSNGLGGSSESWIHDYLDEMYCMIENRMLAGREKINGYTSV